MQRPGTAACPTGDRPKQPCDGRRRQLFQRPLFAYLTFSYFVRSIVLLAGFSTALQWWQYYALRGIHECDLDLQIRHRSPQKSPPPNKQTKTKIPQELPPSAVFIKIDKMMTELGCYTSFSTLLLHQTVEEGNRTKNRTNAKSAT